MPHGTTLLLERQERRAAGGEGAADLADPELDDAVHTQPSAMGDAWRRLLHRKEHGVDPPWHAERQEARARRSLAEETELTITPSGVGSVVSNYRKLSHNFRPQKLTKDKSNRMMKW